MFVRFVGFYYFISKIMNININIEFDYTRERIEW